MDVTVQNFEAMTVASVRHTGPYEECIAAWNTLGKNPKVNATFGPDTKFIGASYDDPETTDPDKIRYDACATIPDAEVDFGEGIVTQTIGEGKYAVCIHKGPFEELIHTYKKLYKEWLPTSGYTPLGGPCLEIYLNDPETTPPEELLTEIRIPLK